MNYSVKFCSVLLLLLCCGFGVRAQNTRQLSLDEAITLGLRNNKQLRIAYQKTDAMQAKVTQVRNQLLPSVNLSANYTRISNNVEPFKVQFSPTEPAIALNPQILNQSYNRVGVQYGLFTGFRALNTLKSAEYLAKATELDAEKDSLEAKLNIISAYYNFYKLIVSKRVLVDNLKTLDSRLVDTRHFLEQGIALQNDVLKLELNQANLQQNMADLQSAIDISNFNLNLMLGLPEGTQIVVDETPLNLNNAAVLNAGSLISEALQNRAEIKAIQWRKMAGERAVEISKGSYYPIVYLGANYDYNLPNQRVFPPEDAFKGTWLAGITASYNLVNLYSTKALVQEQKANLAQTTSAQAQIADAIAMEVNANFSGYGTALQKIQLAEKAVTQATENQRIMKTRYTNQVATLTELLEADTLFTQAQLNLVNAKADAELAFAKLQKSIGK